MQEKIRSLFDILGGLSWLEIEVEKQTRKGCQIGSLGGLTTSTLLENGSIGPEHGEIPLNFSDLFIFFGSDLVQMETTVIFIWFLFQRVF